MPAYLDNAATTKPCPAAVEAVTRMMTETYGNPASLHQPGVDAHRCVETARQAVASSIGAQDAQEILFTSGGTESNNLALLGGAAALRRKGMRIVTTAVEHESVLESAKELERRGFDVAYLPCDRHGAVSQAELQKAVTPDTILVSMMLVNNETGAVQPVQALRRTIQRAGSPALIHVDAVQAYGKLPVDVRRLDADLLSLSAHKVHGPKGVGALYLKKGTPLTPRTFGGSQERRLRPGTHASPLIAGFHAAVMELGDLGGVNAHVRRLKQQLLAGLDSMDGILLHSHADASPYVVSLSVPGYPAQTMIQYLSQRGVYVSNGSACTGGSRRSHVLTAMGLSGPVADSTIRVSFSRDNTPEDVAQFLTTLNEGIQNLARSPR